jgi:hypothetical protein
MRSVPLGTDEKLFRRLHRRYLDEGHPTPPWDHFDPSGLSPEEAEVARRAWGARMESEYRSMVVFSELVARFPEVGFPLEVTTAATRLLQDEARHTELCAKLADKLGGHHDVALDARGLRLVSDRLPAHLFVARWTISMFCVGEAASVGLLQSLAAHVTDPCATVVVRTLLRDEILHDRFGWALARLAVARLTDDERDWLGAELARAFHHYERVDANCLRPDGGEVPEGPPPTSPNLGVVPAHIFARAFYQRLDRVILPALAALGVPAYEAWALRQEAGSFPR